MVMPIQLHSEKVYFIQISDSDQLQEKMIENEIKKILNALELFINKISNYKKPEILENGDIIIRRIKPSQSDPPTNIKKKSGKQDTGI